MLNFLSTAKQPASVLYVKTNGGSSDVAKEFFLELEQPLLVCNSVELAVEVLSKKNASIKLVLLDLTSSSEKALTLLEYMANRKCLIPIAVISDDGHSYTKQLQFYKNKGLVFTTHSKTERMKKASREINALLK